MKEKKLQTGSFATNVSGLFHEWRVSNGRRKEAYDHKYDIPQTKTRKWIEAQIWNYQSSVGIWEIWGQYKYWKNQVVIANWKI